MKVNLNFQICFKMVSTGQRFANKGGINWWEVDFIRVGITLIISIRYPLYLIEHKNKHFNMSKSTAYCKLNTELIISISLSHSRIIKSKVRYDYLLSLKSINRISIEYQFAWTVKMGKNTTNEIFVPQSNSNLQLSLATVSNFRARR